MNKLRLLCVFSIQLSLCAAHASVITKTLNEQVRISAPIAAAELNRISVQGDRIHQIFGAEGKFNVETDNESGQLFLKPLNAADRHAINITIITENGNTQDLKLLPQKGDAISLLLKSTAQNGKDKVAVDTRSPCRSEHILNAVQQAYAANRSTRPEACVARRWPEPLQAECLSTRSEGDYKVTTYRLTNGGDTAVQLLEQSFVQPEDIALALTHQYLAPQTATTLIVVQQGVYHD